MQDSQYFNKHLDQPNLAAKNSAKSAIKNSGHHGPADVVSCNGTKNESSHPLIYLSLKGKNSVICPYCSKVFKAQLG